MATPAVSPCRRSSITMRVLTPRDARGRVARSLGAGTLTSRHGRPEHAGGDREQREPEEQRVSWFARRGGGGRGGGGNRTRRRGRSRGVMPLPLPVRSAVLLPVSALVPGRAGRLARGRRVGRSGGCGRSGRRSGGSRRHPVLRVRGRCLSAARGDALDVLVGGGRRFGRRRRR